MDELRRALLEPGFTLYLGRKACPLALPMHPRVVNAVEWVEDALAGVSLSTTLEELAAAGDSRMPKLVRHFELDQTMLPWDDGAETRLDREQAITRRDTALSRRRWQFKTRDEHRAHLVTRDPS